MKYTQEEKDIIKNNISKYPTNLEFAFAESEKELVGRTRKGIMLQYYAVIRKEKPIMSLATQQGFTVNIKNTPMSKDDKVDLKREIMMDILTKMTKSEKRQVLNIILEL